jgi:hypothetical protein
MRACRLSLGVVVLLASCQAGPPTGAGSGASPAIDGSAGTGGAADGPGDLRAGDGPAFLDAPVTLDAPTVPDAPVVPDASPRDVAADAGGGGPLVSVQCGGPQEFCCAGNTCTGGGCCVEGRCLENGSFCAPYPGVCTDGGCGGCGAPGQPCCGASRCTAPSSHCAPSATSSDLACRRCGTAVGEPCCLPAGTSSDGWYGALFCPGAGLACDATGSPTRCVACGGPGQPCCPGARCTGGGCCYDGKCVPAGQDCDLDAARGGFCSNGRCSTCGGDDQLCCGAAGSPDAVCHSPGRSCQGNRCATCGGAGEQCCPDPGNAHGSCGSGLVCGTAWKSAAICQRCGGPGQSCCGDGACAGGNCCLAGRCQAEGDSCLARMVSYGTCRAGRCGCGGKDEVCCPVFNGRSVCTEPGTVCTGIVNAGDKGTCKPCGETGAPCCAGGTCRDPGAGCLAQNGDPTCVACGDKDQRCCPGTNDRPLCKDTSLVCEPGADGLARCQPCGVAGSYCCKAGTRSTCQEPETVCADLGSGPRCYRCGTASQDARLTPCCPGNICKDGSCCVGRTGRLANAFQQAPVCIGVGASCPGTSGSCDSGGSCGGCGGPDQPCCGTGTAMEGRFCSAPGTVCRPAPGGDFTCRPCGQRDQPCCRTDYTLFPICVGNLRCTFFPFPTDHRCVE